jgi:hypothetical protein
MGGHGLSLPAFHVALPMLKAPKRGNLVHKSKIPTQVGHHRRSIAMEIDREDIPCYEVTVKIVVTAFNIDRAEAHISDALRCVKNDNDCEIFDWEFVDWEEA